MYGSKDESLGYTSRDNLKSLPNSKVVEIEGVGFGFYNTHKF